MHPAEKRAFRLVKRVIKNHQPFNKKHLELLKWIRRNYYSNIYIRDYKDLSPEFLELIKSVIRKAKEVKSKILDFYFMGAEYHAHRWSIEEDELKIEPGDLLVCLFMNYEEEFFDYVRKFEKAREEFESLKPKLKKVLKLAYKLNVKFGRFKAFDSITIPEEIGELDFWATPSGIPEHLNIEELWLHYETPAALKAIITKTFKEILRRLLQNGQRS